MEQQRYRERVATITSALAKGLSVYALPRHVNDARAEGELLQHMADTVNRYIEVDANEGVIRERIARAFSMMAATYDRRDWPTPAGKNCRQADWRPAVVFEVGYEGLRKCGPRRLSS